MALVGHSVSLFIILCIYFMDTSASNFTDFRQKLFETKLSEAELSILPGIDADDDFEHWKPPLELQKDAPTYITGFDNSSRPVWVMEWGKYNFQKYAKNKKTQAILNKYLRYICYLGLKSHGVMSTEENPIHENPLIVDMEGLKLDFITDRRILQYQVKLMSGYRRFLEKHIGRLYIINVNPISEVFLNFSYPFIWRLLDRMEVYGTSKNIWAPKLLKAFSPNLLPEWYGGTRDFKPLYVMG